ncbi:MAG: DNA polymerase III subunit gamma/tau [Bacteroidota bacterium]
MSYIVTARKWRPMVFEDVLGQQHIATTLRNAIRLHRIAHAYIFSGPRGVGKTSMARILAKAVNCRSPHEINPCNECDMCLEITAGRSLDVIEIDGASNRGIDEIRNLRESVRYGPSKGKYKVYIIDEVHMLTKEAFNALLKTLEEPPSHVLFIFATTEVHKVPSTILSRCQRFDFRRIPLEQIVERLRFIAQEEGISIDEESLLRIAKRGEGSMRDAQSIFDQVASYAGGTITAAETKSVLNIVDEEFFFRVTELVKSGDTKEAVNLAAEIINRGYDIREFLSGVAEHLRNLLVCKATNDETLLEVSPQMRKQYMEEVHQSKLSEEDLLRLLRLVVETENAVRWSPQPRYRLEACLLQIAKFDQTVSLDSLLQRLDELYESLSRNSEPGGGIQAPQVKNQKTMYEVKRTAPGRHDADVSASIAPEAEEHPGASGKQRDKVAAYPDNSLPPLNLESFLPKWNDFIDSVRKEKIHLGTILREAEIYEVANGSIRIAVLDKLHLDRLKKERQFLTERLRGIVGAKVLLDFIIRNPRENASAPGEGEKSASGGEAGNSTNDLHPVEKLIIREFGAEPLEG